MKKVSLFLAGLAIAASSYAQSAAQSVKGTYYYYSIGGSRPEGYEVQKVVISDKAIEDKNITSPGTFDFNYKITKVIEKDGESRFIIKNEDGTYNAFVLKNITAKSVKKGFIADMGKKTEAEVINAKANDQKMSEMFTEEGYKEQEAKPVLKELTRENVLEVVGGYEKMMEAMKKDTKFKTDNERSMAGMMAALAIPKMWLEKKGYNSYKSLENYSKSLENYKNDPEIKKRMEAVFGAPPAKKDKK